MYRIHTSIRRTVVALVLTLGGVVLLQQTRILDSSPFTGPLFGQEPQQAPEEAALPFTATAYCKGTTTASGVRVRSGIAAADPALLPIGSVVRVETGDERYDGIYTVMDTGPAVKGRTIDVYIWSCNEALQFGRRPVGVTILRLGWDPAASTPPVVDDLFSAREAEHAGRQPAAAGAEPPARAPNASTSAAASTPLP